LLHFFEVLRPPKLLFLNDLPIVVVVVAAARCCCCCCEMMPRMRVCFEIFLRLSVRFVRRKEGKNEAFSMRASLSFCARDPKKNANAHFVSFFDERKKTHQSFNQKKREKRHCGGKRIAFFLSNAQLSSFLRPFFSS
jgi:hypothetical protein